MTAEQNTELQEKTILHELLQLQLSPRTIVLIFFPTPQIAYSMKTSRGVLALLEMCCPEFSCLLQMHCLPRVSKLVGDMTKILVP